MDARPKWTSWPRGSASSTVVLGGTRVKGLPAEIDRDTVAIAAHSQGGNYLKNTTLKGLTIVKPLERRVSIQIGRFRSSLFAVVGCSFLIAAISAVPALAGTVSPALAPGSGGSAAVTSEGARSPLHSSGNPGPLLAVCYAESGFLSESNVGGWAEGKCTEAKEQEIEVCVEQQYEGSWHTSETCAVVGPSYVTRLRAQTRRSLTCTHGRKFRVWNWYYTPGGSPEVTTGLYPSESGETRC